MEKSIYDLELHESMNNGEIYVIRVPGGWLYETYDEIEHGVFHGRVTFVPFNSEFQEEL